MSTSQLPLLVTGASGHLGQRVIAHLLNTLKIPAGQIIATTRNPEALAGFAAKGVIVRKADFEDTAALAKAFTGARRLLLISTDALDRPGRRLAQHINAVQAAVDAGVQHVVYTSMPKPAGSPLLIAPDHLGTEQALSAAPLSWTVLRNNWYFENLFMSLQQVLASGQWFTAAGDGKIAHIARDDLALAAAAALASNDTGKATYTLSGAEAFTTAEIARLVSQTAGKPIQVVQVPVEGLIQGLVDAGLPEGLAAVFASFDTNTRAGGVADITGDFRKLTGVAPLAYRDWLLANKAAISGT
ncbi:NAD(P)H dehydrogenase (quinone) [Methylophilaceae bacterium]|nr:NAD(P)H dehydrogenase (quinone) [Methylophilaceae bacterium]